MSALKDFLKETLFSTEEEAEEKETAKVLFDLLDIDFAEKDSFTDNMHKDFPELNFGNVGRFGCILRQAVI